MPVDKDYRNTRYCPVLKDVEKQKAELDKEIKSAFPRTKIVYNKVRERAGSYHKKFAKIYNEKCGYCGVAWGLLPTESFEIDHFINEASFPDTKEGRAEAGKLDNLIWSCISCNRGKKGMTIEAPYDQILNVDNGNIADVFERTPDYYIKISEAYQKDEFIKTFYENLHLGYETRRLDYLLMQLDGRRHVEKDEKRRAKWNECFIELSEIRNHMVVTDGARCE
ncbi:MAG: HNH endonuclease [Clostridiales bacterium]|nr:HNH endonuclease [Clostridiales bacterium]